MKNILFVIMIALTVIGCNKEVVLEPQEFISFTNSLKSNDGIHSYAVSDEYIYKQKISDNKTIWKKRCTVPSSIEIDLGYGEQGSIKFNGSLVLETDKLLFVLWKAVHNNQYYNHIGLYSLSGDFIKNTQGDYLNKYKSPIIVDMKKNNFLVLNRSFEGGYAIIDNKLNIVENNNNIKLDYFKSIEFISNRKYITHDDSSIAICDLDKGSINPNIVQFVKSQYPNESNPPKYTISEIKASVDFIDSILKVTLYNGEIKLINIKINCNTGIIE